MNADLIANEAMKRLADTYSWHQHRRPDCHPASKYTIIDQIHPKNPMTPGSIR